MKRIQLTPSPRAGLYSRPPLERMMRMHQRLKAGRYPNCRKLADELEVSAKTVQRDIDFMRYRLGLPIEYDQLHFGFYYTEPVASFPNVEISEGELVALYIGQKALTQYKGTSFEAPLSTAFRKITDGLRDTISVTWSDLESAKAKGVQYLVIPAKSFWWLDDYRKFRARVEDRYAAIVRDENTCIIFDLRESSK